MPRSIAFLSLWKAIEGHQLQVDVACLCDARDKSLAQELAHGAAKRFDTLMWQVKNLAKRTLKLKKREKALLATALYQYYFLDRIPPYAIFNETMRLAKKHSPKNMWGFIAAICKEAEKTPLVLPQDDEAIFYSYPQHFIDLVKEQYKTSWKDILERGNSPPKLFARKGLDVFRIDDVAAAIKDGSYVQNPTQVALIRDLTEGLQPKNILDLCAAPGGKTLLLKELFPTADIVSNDSNKERLKILEENLQRLGQNVSITCYRAEDFPKGSTFDLIVADVPCSNSGCLSKRPEARFRLNKESLGALHSTQKAIVASARTLVAPGGFLLYTTCSILEEENHLIVADFDIQKELFFSPTASGHEGGYGALLKI